MAHETEQATTEHECHCAEMLNTLFDDGSQELNVVEFEYLLLRSLEQYLNAAKVTREHNTTRFSFQLADNQRAFVSFNIEKLVLCNTCKKEIVFPRYKQTDHDNCEVEA